MSEETEPRVITIDLDVDSFTVGESRAFREHVGCNPEYALFALQRAVNEGRAEAFVEFGDAMDKPGWTPPAGWAPTAMLNADPAYLCGFAWICARRSDPDLTYEALEQTLPMGELMDAFYAALAASIERAVREAAPLAANRAERRSRQRTPRTQTASKSRASTAGRSRRSTP